MSEKKSLKIDLNMMLRIIGVFTSCATLGFLIVYAIRNGIGFFAAFDEHLWVLGGLFAGMFCLFLANSGTGKEDAEGKD